MGTWPKKFLDEIKEILKEEYDEFLLAMDMPPHAALRVNPLREGALKEAQAYFAPDGERVPWSENGYYADKAKKPGSTVQHACGAFYMQDASAMAPAVILNPKPGERVLDLCAAPGGKSGQIAERISPSGFLLSNEIEFSRAKILAGNLERLGAGNAMITCASAQALSKKLPGFFDAVLVDAPCSGEGMFRRDANAVLEWNENSPAGCHMRQAEILDSAAEMLAPGGRLVYSTCTFNRLENEESVFSFLSRHPDFEAEDFSLPGVGNSVSGMLRLWPHKVRGEGHFAALLRKKGQAQREIIDYKENALKEKEEILKCAVRSLPEGKAVRAGDEIYLAHPLAPNPLLLSGAGVRMLRAGLPIAEALKNRVEPHHALAMALKAKDAVRTCRLSEEEAEKYLSGEAINTDSEKGWTLAVYHDMPLGWGKTTDGIMKNHLPKGLRKRR
ncbi:MAG: RsmF rRNA methyltransferase first C-terminal domain-containing protein [Clostridia bacterium]|nr:RsmF rRNA methyltransferase first C-terminal domain-containing protein [Clostridia bacterium]